MNKSKINSMPQNQQEPSEEDLQLIELAKKASRGSFSPLSGFPVGAALLIKDANGHKHFIEGSNYETQNYRSVCAEKHALQSAQGKHAPGEIEFLKIAIFSPKHKEPLFPCGDCRQTLLERNPQMKVICVGANGNHQEFTADELLPHGFRLTEESNNCAKIESPLLNFIVHFPVLKNKLNYLKGIQGLIVVGSPLRAAKLAKYFHELPANHFDSNFEYGINEAYCHIGDNNTDREYSLFIVSWRKGQEEFKIGIASHGIGASGIEITLAEINALIALANQDDPINEPPLKAAIRCGTRGTIADIALGTMALTTKAFNEISSNSPDENLTEKMRQASQSLNINLEEGACLSAQFFWSGQGRTAFPLLSKKEFLEKENDKYLRSWKEKGIKWIEMEDYYLNHFCRQYGIASASLGVIVAKRYNSKTDAFELDYDVKTKKETELIPAEIALLALKNYLMEKI